MDSTQHPGALRFWQALRTDERQWLLSQLNTAVQPTPTGWLHWHWAGEQRFVAGLVPAGRLAAMAAALPGSWAADGAWTWHTGTDSVAARSETLQRWLWQQHTEGELTDWRNEAQDWVGDAAEQLAADGEPTKPVLLRIERCGLLHLGLRSRAVHVNGFMPDGCLVVGQRSQAKRQDPGLFDNLMAGGMCAGESWRQTFARELMEEAGLQAQRWPAIPCAGVADTARKKGCQWCHETLIVCNLGLNETDRPVNQDGEVQAFLRFEPSQAIGLMQQGAFTSDGIVSLAVGLQRLT